MAATIHCASLVLAFAGAALTCAAQHGRAGGPLRPPRGVTADAPAGWTPFSSEEGEYKVLFPGTPKRSTRVIDLEDGGWLMRTATYEATIVYTAMFIRCPVDAADREEVKDYFDSLRVGELESEAAAEQRARVVSETDMPQGRHPGRFLHVDLGGAVYRRRAVIAKGRLYVLTAVAPKGAGRAAAKKHETLSMKFLNSFELTGG